MGIEREVEEEYIKKVEVGRREERRERRWGE